MAHPNETLLYDAYGALAEGNYDALLALCAPDITLHIPGRGPQSGTYRGLDGFEGFLRKLSELTEGTFHIELSEVLAGDRLAVGLAFLVGKREGQALDMRIAHVWEVTDGRLSQLWSHPANQYELDAFFSGGAEEAPPETAAPGAAAAKPEPAPAPKRRAAKPAAKPAAGGPISKSSGGRGSRAKPAE